MAFMAGGEKALAYAESRNYTEPLFVFVVMVVAGFAARAANRGALVNALARVLPVPHATGRPGWDWPLVPLLGSLDHRAGRDDLAALMLAPLIFRPQVREASSTPRSACCSSTSRSAAR